MIRWDFVSKPNRCDGCPFEKISTVEIKRRNLCHRLSSAYDVLYMLNGKGNPICKLRKHSSSGTR